MRKLFIAVAATAIAFTAFAVFASADAGKGGTSWTFSFSSNKVNAAVGSDSLIEPAIRDDKGTADESDDTFAAAKTSTIKFPKSSVVDTSVPPRCKVSASDVGSGREECPKKTLLGDGEAKVLVGSTYLNAVITAYNKKGKILFSVQTCGVGTGPTSDPPKECEPAGPPNVLEGTWSKTTTRPTLVVPTPKTLLDLGVTIVRFHLVTKKITKRVTVKVNGKKRKVLRSFAFTPKKCTGKWTSSATEEYVSDPKQTIPDSQTCKKP